MDDNGPEPEEPSARVRTPQALVRWLICGSISGVLFGGGYAYLWLTIFEQRVDSAMMLVVSIFVAAVIGAGFAAWQRGRSSSQSSLGTWMGFLSGLIVALIFGVIAGGGIFQVFRRPVTLAGIAFIPAMAGFLVGGFLDRLFEPWLFSAKTGSGEQP